MRAPLQLLLPLALALAAPALAGSTVILRADFDSDTVAQPPDLSLPGDPSDDALTLSTHSGSDFTVVSDAGPLTGQPLLAHRSAGPGGFGAQFLLPEAHYRAERLRITWCAAPITNIPTTFMSLRGTQGAFFGAVNYRQGDITINTAWGSNNEVPVAEYAEGVAQCFDWTVDRVTGQQTLLIDGTPVAEDLQTNLGSTTVDLLFFAYAPCCQWGFEFAIDDVVIEVLDASMAVDEESWGRIKSSYR